MTNPYYQPFEIDGAPRRPIVERVEKCRPTFSAGPIVVGWTEWEHGAELREEVSLRLTRLAVIEWLQQQHKQGRVFRVSGSRGDMVLANPNSDEEYNELAHLLADSLGVER